MRRALFCLIFLPACIGAKRMERAQSHVELGIAYYKEGSVEDSIRTLAEAHKEDPRNWRALSAMGVVYASKGKNDLAEKSFKKALVLKPKSGEILLNYGAFLDANGRPQEAVAMFTLALDDIEYKNGALIHSNLSRALLDTGNVEGAIAEARQALARAPGLCEAFFHLGLAQEQKGDAAAALEAYQQLITTCPKESLGAKLRRGCLLAKDGAPDSARASLQDVLDEAPGTPMADAARACMSGAAGG